MNKKEIIEALVAKTGVEKAVVAKVYAATFELVSEEMLKGDFKVDGFGVFRIKESKAREGRNPVTGEVVKIPAKRKAAFRPSKALKDRIG